MRATLVLGLLLVIILLWCIYTRRSREQFFPEDAVLVSWTPGGPIPGNLAYNWGVCIQSGPTGNTPQGLCSTQTPVYPPGTPGTGWDYKGQTLKGQSGLTLNNVNCSACAFGQQLVLQLQSVDVVNPTHPTSGWVVFTIDLSSKMAPTQSSITDSVATTEPIYPGSIGFDYIITFPQPILSSPNTTSRLEASLVRGGQIFYFTKSVPLTTINPNGLTGIYTGDFMAITPTSPWTVAPGAIQLNDRLTVEVAVFTGGDSPSNGEVYFAGNILQTAAAITPSSPSGVSWNLA